MRVLITITALVLGGCISTTPPIPQSAPANIGGDMVAPHGYQELLNHCKQVVDSGVASDRATPEQCKEYFGVHLND